MVAWDCLGGGPWAILACHGCRLGEIGRSAYRGAPGERRAARTSQAAHPPIRWPTGYYGQARVPFLSRLHYIERSNAIEPQALVHTKERAQCRARGYSSLCSWSIRWRKFSLVPASAEDCTAPNIVCTAGPSFFAAAIDGITMPNAGTRATAFLVACASDVGLHGAHLSSLRVHERCL